MKTKVGGLHIEWDAHKNSLNKKKHGIGFKEAAFVFFDDNRVELFDIKHSEQEERYIAIDMVRDILLVVYTDRQDTIRIISARKATLYERNLYYEQNS